MKTKISLLIFPPCPCILATISSTIYFERIGATSSIREPAKIKAEMTATKPHNGLEIFIILRMFFISFAYMSEQDHSIVYQLRDIISYKDLGVNSKF